MLKHTRTGRARSDGRLGTLGQHDAKLAEVAQKVVVVGIDVASRWHYVQPIDAATGRTLEKAFRIENDRSGFNSHTDGVSLSSAATRPTASDMTGRIIAHAALYDDPVKKGIVKIPWEVCISEARCPNLDRTGHLID